jgi:hypothetical protein
MPRGRKKKAPFEDLDQDFKDDVANMKDEEIKAKLCEVAINEHENREAKKADQDLQQKHDVFSLAGEVYREGTKMNKLRTAYCYDVLAARGKV